jgi:hypothetical protein
VSQEIPVYRFAETTSRPPIRHATMETLPMVTDAVQLVLFNLATTACLQVQKVSAVLVLVVFLTVPLAHSAEQTWYAIHVLQITAFQQIIASPLLQHLSYCVETVLPKLLRLATMAIQTPSTDATVVAKFNSIIHVLHRLQCAIWLHSVLQLLLSQSLSLLINSR